MNTLIKRNGFNLRKIKVKNWNGQSLCHHIFFVQLQYGFLVVTTILLFFFLTARRKFRLSFLTMILLVDEERSKDAIFFAGMCKHGNPNVS